MVYAPRNEEEVEIVRRIVAAAVWWVGGVDMDEKFGEEAEETMSQQEKEEREQEMDMSCQLPGYIRTATS
jgi:hypothetical protein